MNKEKEVVDKLIELTENEKLSWVSIEKGFRANLPITTISNSPHDIKTCARIDEVEITYPNPYITINNITVVEDKDMVVLLVAVIKHSIYNQISIERDIIVSDLLSL